MSKLINTELKSDSDSESSDSDSDLDSELSDSDLANLCFSSSVNYNYILKCVCWGSNLNMPLCFEGAILKNTCFEMYFLREQF